MQIVLLAVVVVVAAAAVVVAVLWVNLQMLGRLVLGETRVGEPCLPRKDS